MARILYWNINNFSLNKIADPANPVPSQDRRDHIVDQVLLGLPAVPHIFVIVEVYARLRDVSTEGVVLGGNAATGAIALLNRIRVQTGNANWRLVPPVWSGYLGFCEGIAVFYDDTAVQFTGPYVFGPDFRTAGQTRSGAWKSPPTNRACPMLDTAQPGGTPALPPGWITGPQLYGGAWTAANCLPNRVTPGGVMPNENRLAGQYEFYTGAGARISFPTSYNRSPFLTTFDDLAVAGRTIKLFAMHTSPGLANRAVQRLPAVFELAPNANEVSVVVGDFNADTFDSRAAYDGLVGAVGAPAGFRMAFRPETGGAIQANRRPYCLTHLLPTNQATPDGLAGPVAASPVHDVYPRFGYMGTMGGWRFQTPTSSAAIDNILTQYGGGVAGGPATNATIVNTVVGQPYNWIAAPANVTAELTGGLAVASTLANGIAAPGGEDSTAPGATGPGGATTVFRQWPNFGVIHSTSDHLALAVDV